MNAQTLKENFRHMIIETQPKNCYTVTIRELNKLINEEIKRQKEEDTKKG